MRRGVADARVCARRGEGRLTEKRSRPSASTGAGWTAPTLGAAVCALAAAAFALAAPNARADDDAARLLAPAARAEGACELQGERASSERAA